MTNADRWKQRTKRTIAGAHERLRVTRLVLLELSNLAATEGVLPEKDDSPEVTTLLCEIGALRIVATAACNAADWDFEESIDVAKKLIMDGLTSHP